MQGLQTVNVRNNFSWASLGLQRPRDVFRSSANQNQPPRVALASDDTLKPASPLRAFAGPAPQTLDSIPQVRSPEYEGPYKDVVEDLVGRGKEDRTVLEEIAQHERGAGPDPEFSRALSFARRQIEAAWQGHGFGGLWTKSSPANESTPAERELVA